MHQALDSGSRNGDLRQGEIEERDSLPGRPLKICVVGPTGSHLIYQRTCHFARLGHDVTFVAEHKVEDPLEGVAVYRIPHVFHEFLGPLKQVFLYRRAIQTIDPDIVLAQYPHGPWGWGAALAGYPLALSIMGGDILFDEMGSTTVHDRRATIGTFACADFIAAKSNYILAELKRLGGFDRKAVRILWMIDRRIFRRIDVAAFRATLGLADDEQVIFSPKSLQPYYNVHLVVEAMPAILRRHPRTRLLISEQSAQPDYKAAIEARISDLGLGDRVLFVGKIANEKMPEFFSLATMAVAIPPSDGLPMAYLEAMACGTVNVVSRLENTKEIVADGYNALAIDITSEAVAEAAIRVLEEQGLRERLIDGGFETINRLASLEEELQLIQRRLVDLVAGPWTPPARKFRWEVIRESYRYSWERLNHQGGFGRAIIKSLGLRAIRSQRAQQTYLLLRRRLGRPSQHDHLPLHANFRSVLVLPFLAWFADNTIGRRGRDGLQMSYRRWMRTKR